MGLSSADLTERKFSICKWLIIGEKKPSISARNLLYAQPSVEDNETITAREKSVQQFGAADDDRSRRKCRKPYLSISVSFPLAINSASLARSLYMTRSFSTVGHTDRIAACAPCPRFEVFSGARKSIA